MDGLLFRFGVFKLKVYVVEECLHYCLSLLEWVSGLIDIFYIVSIRDTWYPYLKQSWNVLAGREKVTACSRRQWQDETRNGASPRRSWRNFRAESQLHGSCSGNHRHHGPVQQLVITGVLARVITITTDRCSSWRRRGEHRGPVLKLFWTKMSSPFSSIIFISDFMLLTRLRTFQEESSQNPAPRCVKPTLYWKWSQNDVCLERGQETFW